MNNHKKQRENQYDLLRLFAMISVIVIHTAGIYVGRIGQIDIRGMGALAVMDTASTYAVPCFVMLSGAFTIGNDKNRVFLPYYKKIFFRLGIPALLFSVLYTLISIPQSQMGTDLHTTEEVLHNSLMGLPYYHMWYVYMMIWIYVLAPVIVRLRMKLKEHQFLMLSILAFLLCMWAFQGEHHNAQWDPRYSICFIGYFMMGYALRILAKKSTVQSFVFTGAGAVLLTGESYLRYLQLVGDLDKKYILTGSASIGIMLASLCLFYGFSCMDIKSNAGIFIRESYLIYLLHGGVLTMFTGSIYLMQLREQMLAMDVRLVVPLLSALVFGVSWLLAQFIAKITGNIRNMFCKKMGNDIKID